MTNFDKSQSITENLYHFTTHYKFTFNRFIVFWLPLALFFLKQPQMGLESRDVFEE